MRECFKRQSQAGEQPAITAVLLHPRLCHVQLVLTNENPVLFLSSPLITWVAAVWCGKRVRGSRVVQ